MAAYQLTVKRAALREAERATIQFIEAFTRAAIDKALAAPVARLEKSVAALFRQQARDLVAKLEPFANDDQLLALFDDIFNDATLTTSADMLAAIEKAVTGVYHAGATNAIDTVGASISFELDNPRAVEYLDNYGADLITGIDDTTRETIKGIVRAAVDEGETYNQIAKRIKDRYKQFAVGKPQEHIDSRAHLVAVTEMGNAYQAGNLAAVQTMQDSGLTMEKRWLTVGDDRVSDGCKDNQRAGWIALDDEFPSGDERPLRFPGCRCVLQYRRKRD